MDIVGAGGYSYRDIRIAGRSDLQNIHIKKSLATKVKGETRKAERVEKNFK